MDVKLLTRTWFCKIRSDAAGPRIILIRSCSPAGYSMRELNVSTPQTRRHVLQGNLGFPRVSYRIGYSLLFDIKKLHLVAAQVAFPFLISPHMHQPHASHVSLQKSVEYWYTEPPEPDFEPPLGAGSLCRVRRLEVDFIETACESTLEDVLHGSLADENRRAAHRVSCAQLEH